MERLIPVINRLQDIFSATGGVKGIDLPQIVVVGSQSSGKSSVLENIVGKDFLPRGSGIVTRRPLILQLNRTDTDEDWAEFQHQPGRRYTDFNQVRDEISADTERVARSNKGVSPQPIGLRIFSRHVVNLTLVDLPGITKVPVGDQPTDIEQQIRKMVFTYARPKNTIILAVTAANTDLANSDAINISRELDPEGNRTLGVLTKIDIMDAGTNAVDLLQNRVIDLKLGFVGVINRSQKDINENMPIRTALQREREWFSKHPDYSGLTKRLGTEVLSNTLNRLLMKHIRDCLPELRDQVAMMMQVAHEELMQYGQPLFDNEAQKAACLLQLVNQFSQEFVTCIDGTGKNISVAQLYGGARIAYIFQDIFGAALAADDSQSSVSDNEIRTALRNATGPRRSLFVPEAAFDLLVRQQIGRLERPALQCVEFVYEEVAGIGGKVYSKELGRFPTLLERVHEAVARYIGSLLRPSQELVQKLIQMELAYINTSHPDFVSIAEVMAQPPREVDVHKRALPEAPKPLPTTPAKTAAAAPTPAVAPPPSKHKDGDFYNNFFGGAGVSTPALADGPRERAGAVSNVGGKLTLHQPPGVLQLADELTSREVAEIRLVRELLISYMNIVRKNLRDSVPKAIMCNLVNEVKVNLQARLVSMLYQPAMVSELMQEAGDVSAKRQACMTRLTTLQRATEVISELRDFDPATVAMSMRQQPGPMAAGPAPMQHASPVKADGLRASQENVPRDAPPAFPPRPSTHDKRSSSASSMGDINWALAPQSTPTKEGPRPSVPAKPAHPPVQSSVQWPPSTPELQRTR